MLREMAALIRRLAAFAAILALCAGQVAVCAGWQPTPEARRACCRSDVGCPMPDSGGHDHSSSKSGASQAQADRCCAAETPRRDSTTSGSTLTSSSVIAPAPAALLAIQLPAERRAPHRGTMATLRAPSVPKHLLLSILLV
jgi:hypothetical protein